MRILFAMLLVLAMPSWADDVKSPATAVGKDLKLKFLAPTAFPAADFSRFPYFNLPEAELTKAERELWNTLTKGNAPAFDVVTQAWIATYTRRYNETHQTKLSPGFVNKLYQSLITEKERDAADPFTLKLNLDERLKNEIHGEDLVYNIDFSSPLDPLISNRSQCFSGTICFAVAARLAWGEPIVKKFPLIVFMQGHAIPAFAMEDETTHDVLLIGVETTGAGGARRYLGNMKALEEAPAPLRVIDGTLYPLGEIFSDRLPEADRGRLQDFLMAETARRFGFNLAKLEDRVRAEQAARPVAPGDQAVSRKAVSLFGFGVPSTPPGDRKRSPYVETGILLQGTVPNISSPKVESVPNHPYRGETVSKEKLVDVIHRQTAYRKLAEILHCTPEEAEKELAKWEAEFKEFGLLRFSSKLSDLPSAEREFLQNHFEAKFKASTEKPR